MKIDTWQVPRNWASFPSRSINLWKNRLWEHLTGKFRWWLKYYANRDWNCLTRLNHFQSIIVSWKINSAHPDISYCFASEVIGVARIGFDYLVLFDHPRFLIILKNHIMFYIILDVLLESSYIFYLNGSSMVLWFYSCTV